MINGTIQLHENWIIACSHSEIYNRTVLLLQIHLYNEPENLQ